MRVWLGSALRSRLEDASEQLDLPAEVGRQQLIQDSAAERQAASILGAHDEVAERRVRAGSGGEEPAYRYAQGARSLRSADQIRWSRARLAVGVRARGLELVISLHRITARTAAGAPVEEFVVCFVLGFRHCGASQSKCASESTAKQARVGHGDHPVRYCCAPFILVRTERRCREAFAHGAFSDFPSQRTRPPGESHITAFPPRKAAGTRGWARTEANT